jgi:Na+/melibiose symporter-like transporter
MMIGFAANAAPTPNVANGISLLITLAPAAAYALAAAIFYFGYRIEETQVVKMQRDIDDCRLTIDD